MTNETKTEKLGKRVILTTETNGHAHVISTGDRMYGTTESTQDANGQWHSHDWVRDDSGNVLIAPSHSHQHGIKHIMTKTEGENPPDLEAAVGAVENVEKKPAEEVNGEGEEEEKEEKLLNKEIDKKKLTKFFECEVTKVDSELGIVFGWAVICTKNGEMHFDRQDEHVPDDVMLDFSTDFMKNSRVAKAMHDGDQIGDVVFAFPMTKEIKKSLGVKGDKTGLIIGMAPGVEGLAKFEDGTFTGFSIGGYAIYQDVE